jgi:hypothetical protein
LLQQEWTERAGGAAQWQNTSICKAQGSVPRTEKENRKTHGTIETPSKEKLINKRICSIAKVLI